MIEPIDWRNWTPWTEKVDVNKLFKIEHQNESTFLKASPNLKKTLLSQDSNYVVYAPIVSQRLNDLPSINPKEFKKYYNDYKRLITKAEKISTEFEYFIQKWLKNIHSNWYFFVRRRLGVKFNEYIRSKFEENLIKFANRLINEILTDKEIEELVESISLHEQTNNVRLGSTIIDIDPKTITFEYEEYEESHRIYHSNFDLLVASKEMMRVKDQKYLEPIREIWPELYKCVHFNNEGSLLKKNKATSKAQDKLFLAKKYLKKGTSMTSSVSEFRRMMVNKKQVDNINTLELFDVISKSTLNRLYKKVFPDKNGKIEKS